MISNQYSGSVRLLEYFQYLLDQKMLEDARESYLIIIDKYSDHKRAPDSLYKLGEIAVSLGEGLAAVDYFKSVIVLK